MHLRSRWLRWTGRVVVRYPWTLLAVALAFGLLGGRITLGGLALDADYNNLLPAGTASVENVRGILREFGGLSHLLFVVDGPPEGAGAGDAGSAGGGGAGAREAAALRAEFADSLAAALRRQPGLFAAATSRLPSEWFRRRALLFLDPGEMAGLERDVAAQGEALRRFLHAGSARELIDAGSDLLEGEFIAGEEGVTAENDARVTRVLEDLTELALLLSEGRHGGESRGELEATLGTRIDRLITGGRVAEFMRDERIVARDGEALLVIARAARSTLGEEGREFIGETMDGARAAMAYAREQVPGGVRARVTGPLAQEEAEEAVIRDDFQRTGRIAALLITLVLCVILRLWVAPLLALVPLGLALAWTLGTVTLTIGRLNAFSVMFVAIVLGLGIDFGIHLIVRYEEERERGRASGESIQRAITATGSAVTTGAISTIVAFGALIFSVYPAFSELGWVAAIGIGFAFVAFVTVMPAMLLLKDRVLARVAPGFVSHPLGLGWLDRLGRGIERRPWGWAAGLGAVTLGALLLALGVPLGPEQGWLRRGVRFQGDLLVAQPATPVHELQREIIRRFDMGSEPFYFSAPDMETARAWTDTLLALEAEGLLARVVSPARAVPADLEARVAASAGLRERLRDLARVAPRARGAEEGAAAEAGGEAAVDDLGPALERLAGLIEEVGDLAYLAGLDSLPRQTPVLAGRMRAEAAALRTRATTAGAAGDGAVGRGAGESGVDQALRAVLAERRAEIADPAQGRIFTVNDLPPALRAQMVGKSGRLLISAYGRENIYDDGLNGALVQRLRRHLPDVAGVPVLYADLLGLSRREGVRSSRLAFLLVFLAIWADLRRLPRTLVTMVPLMVGVIWTLGAMRLLGLDFNFANVVAAPLLLGIGIDDGVHLMHRWLEEGRGSMGRVLHQTGRAVLLTSLTTMIGFGVFEIAHHRGLESLGRVMVLGVGACFLASVTAFPTLIALEERWRKRKERASGSM